MNGIQIKQAIDILKTHNRWRRGDIDDETNPTKLGIAIDIIISHLEIEKSKEKFELLREFSSFLSSEYACPDIDDEIIQEFLNQ